jgi:hypothetical protein
MIEFLENLYRNARNALSMFKKEPLEKESSEVMEIIEGFKTTIDVIEKSHPEIKIRYERHKAIQQSFTSEQLDFLCYMLDEWYLEWKGKILTGNEDRHRLGYAKELLKSKLCGE